MGREIKKEKERGRLEEEEGEEMVGRETERKRERKGREKTRVLIPSKSTLPMMQFLPLDPSSQRFLSRASEAVTEPNTWTLGRHSEYNLQQPWKTGLL